MIGRGWIGLAALLAACGGRAGTSSSAASSSAGAGGAMGTSSATSGTGGAAPQGTPYVYVGGYDNFIRVFRLGLADGALMPVGAPVDAGSSPSFLAVDPAHRTLLAVNEVGGGNGAVASFHVDAATGGLTFVSRKSS